MHSFKNGRVGKFHLQYGRSSLSRPILLQTTIIKPDKKHHQPLKAQENEQKQTDSGGHIYLEQKNGRSKFLNILCIAGGQATISGCTN